MKTFFRFLAIALLLTKAASAQVESFDIATFVRPSHWIRADSNGIAVLQNGKTSVQGPVCRIFLFPSVPASSNPVANYQTEWQLKVVRALGNLRVPTPQTETTPDGWTVLTGFTDGIQNGIPLRTILITATGFGRSMSFMVLVSPNSFQGEISQFFDKLNLSANTVGQPPLAHSGGNKGSSPVTGSEPVDKASLDMYIFKTPTQWTQSPSPGNIVLLSPTYNNGERCQITMFPLRPFAQPLAAEAVTSFRGIFQADPLGTYPSPPPKLERGMSPEGWEFFSIRKLVGGQEGESRTIGVHLLVAKLDNQVAMIVTTSKDFLTSQCFGELHGDVWPTFLHSLTFKNARSTQDQQDALRQQLAGSWITATASVGLHYTFLANGRFQDAASARHSSQTMTTTETYFGDGSYSVNGNMIDLNRDQGARTTNFFRLQQISKDVGRTWRDELCMMEPGATGEVCYLKE
jgi:hypothetical protein